MTDPTALDVTWRKSSYSPNTTVDCVEVARVGDETWVRNSRDPDGGVLRFNPGEWKAFLAGVNNSEFDLH